MTDSNSKIPRGTIQVPGDLSREIVVYAKAHGTTTHELVREAWELLKRDRTTPPVPAPLPVPESEQPQTNSPNKKDSGSFLSAESHKTVTTIDQSLRFEGQFAWFAQLWDLVRAGVGVEEFRQLLAIFISGDAEALHAISCNLATFSRIETIRTALMRVAGNGKPAEVSTAKGSRSERIQDVSRGTTDLINEQGETIKSIEERREADRRNGRGDIDDTEKSG